MSTATLPARTEANGTQSRPPAMTMTKTGVQLHSFEELWDFAQCIMKSGFAPASIKTPHGIVIALQMGFELGLPPMAALQNIAVINGRPSLWGDAQLAVCRATGELQEFQEWFEQAGKRLPRNPVNYTDDTVAVCRVVRKGFGEQEVGFSVADAKKAGLWNKPGPWQQYPFRMLRSRARSYALRDTFGDALRGLMSADEAGEINRVAAPAAQTGTLNDRFRAMNEADTVEGEIAGKADPDAHELPPDDDGQIGPGDDVQDAQVEPKKTTVSPPAGDSDPSPASEPAVTQADGGEADSSVPAAPSKKFQTFTAFVEACEGLAAGEVDPSIFTAAMNKLKLGSCGDVASGKSAAQTTRGLIVDAMKAGKFDWTAAKIAE